MSTDSLASCRVATNFQFVKKHSISKCSKAKLNEIEILVVMVENWQNVDEEKKKRNLKSTYNPAEITPSNILV